MQRRPIRFMLFLVCTALMTGGCAGSLSNGNKQVNVNDLIIPLNVSEVLKRPESEVLEYFQDRRDNFVSLGNYMLANERLFQARPVILHQAFDFAVIEDHAIAEFARQVFHDGVAMRISSLNDDPSKRVDIWIDSEHGLFRQGITYVSLAEMNQGEPSILNYVENYKDLGGGWYYYVYYYDRLLGEERFRELAWRALSEEERSTVTIPVEQAVVTLEDGANVGRLSEDDKLDIVAAVTFHTELDGLLGPIKLYMDPMSKKVVGRMPRM